MIMALKIGKIISVIAPKVFKIVKNLKSKDGGEGNFNMKLLGKDVAIDLFRVAIVLIVLLAAFGIVSWESVEKAIQYLGN